MSELLLSTWEIICYCFIFVTGLIGNLMVCLVVMKSPAAFRCCNFNMYLFALAVVDLCLAVVCLPVYVFSTSKFHHPTGYGGIIFCKIITGYLLPFWLGGTSIYILAAISVERYQAISNPIVSRANSTTKKAKLNIAFALCIGLLIQLPTVIGITYASSENKATVGNFCRYIWKGKAIHSSIYAVTFTVQYAIPALILIVNFYRIKGNIRKLDTTLSHGLVDKRNLFKMMKKKRRTIRIVFATSLAFFVCWTPNNVMYILFQYGGRQEVAWDSNLYQVGIVLGYFNSCINPILYAFQSKDFRKRCIAITRKMFTLKGPEHTVSNGTHEIATSCSSRTTSDREALVIFDI